MQLTGMKKGPAIGLLLLLAISFGSVVLLSPRAGRADSRDGGAELAGDSDGGASGSSDAGEPSPRPSRPSPAAPGAPTEHAAAAPGSTGGTTPAAQIKQDTFYLSERCIRVHDDVVINIGHHTGSAVKVNKVLLIYPEAPALQNARGEEIMKTDCANVPIPKGSGSACLDLTNYLSLDAARSVVHIDMHQARADEQRAELPKSKGRSLWDWNYALWMNQHATLLVTYVTVEGAQRSEERTVALHPDITNRLRGLCWAVGGLLLTLGFTLIAGLGLRPVSLRTGERLPLPKGAGRIGHLLLSITVTADNRYSISALQMLIWTYVAAYSISYVWTMTGEVVQITPQMLALLGTGGLTAVLSGLITPSGSSIPKDYKQLVTVERYPKLSDLISSGGVPSIYKFQMLIFTLLSAGIVLWEVTRSYTFPNLPDQLVILMGISNGTYVLGMAGSKTAQKKLLTQIEESCHALDQFIATHNADVAIPEWTRSSIVAAFLEPKGQVGTLLSRETSSKLWLLQDQLDRFFNQGASEDGEGPSEGSPDKG